MNIIIKRTLALFLALSLLMPPQVAAEVIGRITYIEGRVDRLQPEGDRYLPLVVGDEISLGDKIRTKSFSKAEVAFIDESKVRVAQNSQFQVEDYVLKEDGLRETALIGLDRGKIRATVSKTPDKAPFNIHTPNAEGRVRGSDLYVSYQKSSTGILVTEGTFETINPKFPNQMINIREGTTSIVPHNAPPKEPRKYIPVEVAALEETVKTFSMPDQSDLDSNLRSVIVRMTGTVEVLKKDEANWLPAETWQQLEDGDKIRTLEGSTTELRLDNGHMIELLEKTQILITSLTRDPVTGDHESRLECAYGKLKAKIGKLHGESKFEVTTPTAITGVRGTILYLIALPNLTTAFFEGGNGYMISRLTEMTKDVLDGMAASIYANGNFSDPEEVNESLRAKFGGSSDGTYGYSPPGGGFGPGDFVPPTGTPGITPPSGLGGPFDDVPFTDPDGTSDGPALTANFEAKFGEFGSFLEDEESIITGTIESDSVQNPFTGTLEATLEGDFENPNDKELWWGTLTGSGISGEALSGWLGGSWHSWDGVFSSIYVDEDGTAGTVFGLLSGDNDDGSLGTLLGGGDLFILPTALADITPAELESSLNEISDSGSYNAIFNDGGSISGIFDRDFRFINDNNWGISRSIYQTGYDNAGDLSSWIGVEAGSTEEGYFLGVAEGTDDLSGALQIDRLGTFLNGEYLGTYLGTILGTYEEGEGVIFEGYGAGTFNKEPITFSGMWNEVIEDETSLYYNQNGYFTWGGNDYGLIGATTSPWDGPAQVTVIGEYYNYGEYGPAEVGDDGINGYLWNTDIHSYNSVQENYTTNDGGAFFGYTGGIWDNGDLNGSLAAIYIDPDGNAGILTGSLNGTNHAFFDQRGEEGFFTLTGEVTADELSPAIGIDAVDLDEATISGEITGNMLGSFSHDIVGFIAGDVSERRSSVHFIRSGEDESEDWGIYDIKINGDGGYTNPEGDASFTASIGGSGDFGGAVVDEGEYETDNGYWLSHIHGNWENGQITGSLSGSFLTELRMGSIGGDLFGLYDTYGGDGDLGIYDGYWIAESVGTWQGDPLTFSGMWNNVGEDGEDSLYYNDDGQISWGGEEWGLIGATTSPWDAPATVMAIGEFYSYGELDDPISFYEEAPESYIWNTRVASYNAIEGNYTTLDGGAFYGYTGGLWDDRAIDGALYTLYIDPDGNFGVLSGNMNGDYEPFIYDDGLEGMWWAAGTVTANPLLDSEFVEISPDELSDHISYGELYSEGVDGFFGSFFTGEPEESNFIEGEITWGHTAFLGGEEDLSGDIGGIYDYKLQGPETFANPGSSIYFLGVFGYGESYDDYGAFASNFEYGFFEHASAGIWLEGRYKGYSRGIYFIYNEFFEGDYVEEEMYVGVGLMRGRSFGLYNDDESTWVGEDLGYYELMGFVDYYAHYSMVNDEYFGGSGTGDFNGSGAIDIIDVDGYGYGFLTEMFFDIDGFEDILSNRGFGALAFSFLGEFSGLPGDNWQAAFGVGANEGGGSVILGKLDGTSFSDGFLGADISGFWFRGGEGFFQEDNLFLEGQNFRVLQSSTVKIGSVEGVATGTFDIGEIDSTFEAAAVGEWVELAELETDLLGFAMDDLHEFVSVPITEIYSDLLTGAGTFDAGGVLNGFMDISFFTDLNALTPDIWGALLGGTFSGDTSDDWSSTFSSDGATATLTGSGWSDGQWQAEVSGSTTDGILFEGGVGGTYTDDGTFSGVGAGTWEVDEPIV